MRKPIVRPKKDAGGGGRGGGGGGEGGREGGREREARRSEATECEAAECEATESEATETEATESEATESEATEALKWMRVVRRLLGPPLKLLKTQVHTLLALTICVLTAASAAATADTEDPATAIFRDSERTHVDELLQDTNDGQIINTVEEEIAEQVLRDSVKDIQAAAEQTLANGLHQLQEHEKHSVTAAAAAAAAAGGSNTTQADDGNSATSLMQDWCHGLKGDTGGTASGDFCCYSGWQWWHWGTCYKEGRKMCWDGGSACTCHQELQNCGNKACWLGASACWTACFSDCNAPAAGRRLLSSDEAVLSSQYSKYGIPKSKVDRELQLHTSEGTTTFTHTNARTHARTHAHSHPEFACG